MVKKQQDKVKKQEYFSQEDEQQSPYRARQRKSNFNNNRKNHYQNSESQSSSESAQELNEQSNQMDEQSSNEIAQKMVSLQNQQQRIKQQLKQLPYGLILKQKQQLQKQKKQYEKKHDLHQKRKKKIKKDNKEQIRDKNQPKQIPIFKKPPKKIPTIFEPKRPKTIDPRFQDYAGTYNQDLAMKAYDFIPKIQQQQINELKKTLESSKISSGHKRAKKRAISQKQRQVLTQEYNRLTNQKRQNQLYQIQKQVKHNLKEKSHKFGPSSSYIPKKMFKQQFQKVKMSKMSEQNRKEYLKKKEKKVLKNQQIQRNNLMYETIIQDKKSYNNRR